MSWIQMLNDTYENCHSLIGKAETEDGPMLMPIAHTTQNAHIELVLDMDGILLGLPRIITDKKNSITVIPCTESSQSRSGSNPVNHPLFDKLQYLAGDYTDFGGEKGRAFHENYMKDLETWCASPYSHPKVRVILGYLRRNSLVSDLVKAKVIPVDENGGVIRAWKKELGKNAAFIRPAPLFPTRWTPLSESTYMKPETQTRLCFGMTLFYGKVTSDIISLSREMSICVMCVARKCPAPI